MTAGVTLQSKLTINGSLTGANARGRLKLNLDEIAESFELTPGTDATTKADLLFADTRTLAASTNESLDLAGALSSALGATITAAELVLIYVKAHAANTNAVNVTRPGSNGVPLFLAAGDGVAVKPGQFFLLQSLTGIAVTAGTGDLINIANAGAGTSVTYDILVVGRSVAA
jgi:hypothetical protein